MKHTIWVSLFLFCLIPALSFSAPSFYIRGLEKNIAMNVQNRLIDTLKNTPTVTVEALQQQVQEALYPYGYFNSDIRIIKKSSETYTIEIKQGPALRIINIDFDMLGEGKTNAELLKAKAHFPLKVGMIFKTEAYEAAKIELLTIAEQQGYLHANFEKAKVAIDIQQQQASITLTLNTGPQYFFGQVRFTDHNYLSDAFLARFVPFNQTTPYSNEQVQDLITNLNKSGYFQSVDVKQQEIGNQIPLILQLKPVDRTNYTLGVGYGTDTGPRGRAGLHVTPVNRHGDKFNAIAQGSISQNAFQMQYLIPGKNPIHNHYSINGGFTNLNYTSGSSNGVLATIADLYNYRDFQSALSINGLHERYSYTGQNKNEENIFFPKALFTLRQVSDELFSPQGYNLTFSAYASSKAVLSSVSMATASIDAKAAYTIEALRLRLYAHGIQGILGISDIYQLPLSMAQLLGGAENMKAYSFNAIGPGKILSYAGLELQKETFENWYLVAFYDAGRVYRPRTSPFQYDAGAGLMWVSPVGPIKVVLAKPVEQPLSPFHGRGLRVVINMGPDL